MLSGAKSDSMVWSQVKCDRPDRRFQWFGQGATQPPRAQLWSTDGSARATWPKNLRWVVRMMCVSDGCSARRWTSSLEMRTLQEMHNIHCRHDWSNAFKFLMSCQVGDHVSAPQRMTGRMRTWQSCNVVGRETEECQILWPREAIQLCATAIHFLISCSLDHCYECGHQDT